ncbi:hypothetical protein F444_06078 [Phytophthora nicotianae P1976]|uniref:Uncharacterized protein n=1 Tax=Phytophthora nicotianae P1976 TaxID=1317066 RepID=A0A081AJY9_PHYNI|nr:hypothetical protein F444_06078 [Phytophthora nicotianae P1976]
MEADTAPDEEDEVLLHAELAAVDALIAAESEKTLSRALGRPESVLFGMELITYMKDTRRDCLPLTARSLGAIVRDSYSA